MTDADTWCVVESILRRLSVNMELIVIVEEVVGPIYLRTRGRDLDLQANILRRFGMMVKDKTGDLRDRILNLEATMLQTPNQEDTSSESSLAYTRKKRRRW